MDFIKNSPEYVVTYSRMDAKKILEEDLRVKEVELLPDGMKIITSPIIPKGYLEPVGTYKIVLKHIGRNEKLSVEMRRVEGTVKSPGGSHVEQYHMKGGYGGGTVSDNVCWGNLERKIRIMREKKDWFWLAKSCIDLICDWKREGGRGQSGATSKENIAILAKQYKEYHKGEKKK